MHFKIYNVQDLGLQTLRAHGALVDENDGPHLATNKQRSNQQHWALESKQVLDRMETDGLISQPQAQTNASNRNPSPFVQQSCA